MPSRALGTHSQVVLPCMLTTHLASWLVSRALKGRTLTATFTEAPAMAPVRPPSSAGEQRQKRCQSGWGTLMSPPSFSQEPASPPRPVPGYPAPERPSLCSPGLPPQCHSPWGLPEVRLPLSPESFLHLLSHVQQFTLCAGGCSLFLSSGVFSLKTFLW